MRRSQREGRFDHPQAAGAGAPTATEVGAAAPRCAPAPPFPPSSPLFWWCGCLLGPSVRVLRSVVVRRVPPVTVCGRRCTSGHAFCPSIHQSPPSFEMHGRSSVIFQRSGSIELGSVGLFGCSPARQAARRPGSDLIQATKIGRLSSLQAAFNPDPGHQNWTPELAADSFAKAPSKQALCGCVLEASHSWASHSFIHRR